MAGNDRARRLRREIVQILQAARRGHLGSALSIVEILEALYGHVMRYKADNPQWLDRDRFILSKGHGCLALYAILADKGYFPREHLWTVGRFDSILGGHPDALKVPGVEFSTGSLGHGLPYAVGVALHGSWVKADWRTYVLLGDGECNEGSVWEAAMCAAKHRLTNLVVLVDYNEMQSYGSTHEILELEPFADKWKSFGFAVREVDGHSVDAIVRALQAVPFEVARPNAIICHTVKGKGVPVAENNPKWHHQINIPEQVLDDMLIALQ
ncbi:MAG: transketolase [Candidatus Xenobia bacterium]